MRGNQSHIERIHEEAGDELRIKVGGFLRHRRARIAHALNVLDRRRIHEESAVSAPRGYRIQRAVRIDGVFEVAARFDGLGLDAENPVEHQRVENRNVELAHHRRSLRQRRFERVTIAKPQQPHRFVRSSQRDADRSAPTRASSARMRSRSANASTSKTSRARSSNDASALGIQMLHHPMRGENHQARAVARRPASSSCSRRRGACRCSPQPARRISRKLSAVS